ncbi:MAG: hypothetical protein FWF12_01725, partial [Betaproteobacteria bacterium]|nr:hypothetical protein [Betaproteobacteria bacterium]
MNKQKIKCYQNLHKETLIYSIRAAQVRVSNTSMSVRRLAGHVSGYVLGGFETRTCDARTLRNCS